MVERGAKNRANKNRRGRRRASLPNPPHFIACPTFGFRPRFTMWTLGNKLEFNFVVCLRASLRLWKDSMQFFYVESNIDNNYSPQCRKFTEPRRFFCFQISKLILAFVNKKTFSPVISVQTSKSNFVTFFVYFGNSLFDYLWHFFVFAASKREVILLLTYREFGVALSEEVEVNQWIALDIPSVISQSERAKNSIHCFSIY